MTSSEGIYEFGEWRLDPAERLLSRNGQAVALTPKVFDTLLLLVENAGHLVSKQEFMARVWPDAFVEDVALAQSISHLRKTFARFSENGATIETVPKRGYRLTSPVQRVPGNGYGPSSPAKFTPSPTWLGASSGTAGPVEDLHTQRASLYLASRKWRQMLLWVSLLGVLALGAMVRLEVIRKIHEVRAAGPHEGMPFAGRLADRSRSPKITPLISLPGEQGMPAFSPDGSRVAFVWQSPQTRKSGIYAVVVGSQSLLRLTGDARDTCPVWSPDGRYLAFIRDSQDQFSIYMLPALGGAERKVYSGHRSPWIGPEGLSLSPDGKLLAFAEWEPDARTSSIRLISIENSAVRSVTSPPISYHDAAPAFSPDGGSLAFVRSTGPIFLDELYVLRLSAGEPRQLTFDHHRIFGAPIWSRDGAQILFASNRAGMKSLWQVSANGGASQPVLGPGPVADHPSISSSTGELAYENSVENENLWRVDLHNASPGGQPKALFSSKTSNLMPTVLSRRTQDCLRGRSIWL